MRNHSLSKVLGLLASAVLLAALVPPIRATSDFTYYVDFASAATSNCHPAGGSPPACTGSCAVPTCGSSGTPCHKIQDAIDIANCSIGTSTTLQADVIVAAGTYPERLFVYPGIHVLGAGRDVTTVDAQTAPPGGNDRRSVVVFSGGLSFGFGRVQTAFSIDGFRLIHGQGSRQQIGGVFERAGGGILVFSTSALPGWPRITDCRIEDNTLADPLSFGDYNWNGAGIYIASGAPFISGNIIQRNVTTPPNQSGQNEAFAEGAGIYSLNGDCAPIITRNIIRNNVSFAQQGIGGGIRLSTAGTGTVVSNNVIVANSANVEGGALGVSGYALAYNNLMVGNIAGGSGAGINSFQHEGALTNNTLVGNILSVHTVAKGDSFSSYGGGIYAGNFPAPAPPSLNPTLTNNLLSKNAATANGTAGGLWTYNTDSPVNNNDFFGDLPDEIQGDYTVGTVIGVNGNVSLDPVFANAPVFWDHTNAAGTATTIIVFDSTRYAVNDWLEYDDDGVGRKITAINNTSKTLTFTPALAAGTTATLRILANWGPSGSPTGPNVTEDFRLTASSPLRDAGTNTGAPAVDLDDLPRPADGDLNGSVITDIGAYEFRMGDTDGDGVPDATDCVPTVNSAWTPPSEVPIPVGISSAGNLSWGRVAQANVYNVYRGTITVPWTYDPTCLVTEVPGKSASIDSVPSPSPAVGQVYYYLVGGVNTCDSGPVHSNPTVMPGPPCGHLNGQSDGDGIPDIDDNCPLVGNSSQADPDIDTVGSDCDSCPTIYNPSQQDANNNQLGDHCEDADSDTYYLIVDCNDNNPAIHPGATEVCNGADDNCVAGIDEGFDGDSDGVTTCGGDCDDTNPAIRPGIPEACNGIDDNCAAGIDEGFDVDGDTFTTCNGDCLDSNPAVHPGALEVCNGLDDNCAGGTDEGGDALCADVSPCTTDICGGAAGCSHPPAQDGTPCNDGSACTQTDTCLTGACAGANPVVCTAPDFCQEPGTCNPVDGLCSAPTPKQDGTTCDDQSACTQTDTCQSGACAGANPVICTTPDTCHDPGTCNPADGVCSAPTPKSNGSACEDGDACTAGDTCQAGACQAGGPRDLDSDGRVDPLCGGTDCNDANPMVWLAPAEVTNLVLATADPTQPTWDSQAALAGPETIYDLVGGTFGAGSPLSFPAASCLQSGSANTFPDGRPNPSPGAAYWYLSRARNSCGTGTFGTPNRNAQIPACP